MEEVTDVPLEGSSFSRHFSVPYEQVKSLADPEVLTFVHPYIGMYKSTTNHKLYPFLNSKDPIEPKLKSEYEMIYKMLSNYEDVLYCRGSPENKTLLDLYCAHVLNHSLKSRKLVIKNNEKEKQFGVSDALRDQGFHRARTLILAPTKESARRIVHTLLRLMPKGSTVSHRRRFERDFGPQRGETDKEKKRGRKPKDYEEWFRGNSNDHFRIGIGFAKKTVKLYSAFVDSDLILASPLGIQTILDEEEEKGADIQYIMSSIELLIIDQAEMLLMQNWSNVQQIVSLLNQRPTKATFNSAARIRLAYLAGYGRRYRQTLVFSAVSTFLITLLFGECENFQGMNYIPPLPSYCGIYSTFLPERIRVPGLNSVACGQKRAHPDNQPSKNLSNSEDVKFHLISFVVPGEVQTHTINNNMKNEDSDSDSEPNISEDSGPNPSTLLISRKLLSRTNYAYLAGRSLSQARLNSFKQRLLPRLRRGLDQRVLIYIPDFYDLEELCQVLRSESLDFCCVHEYTEDTEGERFRTLFSQGRIRILLITERYYFFRRRKICGPQTFIFYGPPTFPWFVKELLDLRYIDKKSDNNVTNVNVLYNPALESHLVTMISGSIDF